MDSTEERYIEPGQAISPEDVLVVGIGASAGGLEAVRRFFEAVPPKPDGVAFVVIMHLDPERESQLAEVLQHRTSLPVAQLTERRSIEPGRVYVIPPNRELLVADGHLTPSQFEKPRGRRAPIDVFFRSLARSPEGGVAIVMSGGGSDGAVGLQAVKEAGGLVMVQDPEEAAHDSMPLAAIATGLADFVLPAEKLAEKVMGFRGARRRIRVPHDPAALPQDEGQALASVLGQLRSRTGHDFSEYKHSTVLRRIERRMQAHHVETLAAYLEFLRSHPPEAQALLKSLLISVTHFFRDGTSWDALAEQVVPILLERDPGEELRIWTPGCATGEEAYALAMLFLEQAGELQAAPDIQVFASDIDVRALAYGRRGIYPEAIEADVSDERLRRFFTKDGSHYQVNEELRDGVLFASHNLLKDPPYSRLDLITCRNLLIYLNRDLQEKVLRILRYALRPGGYLFLGGAETVSDLDAFEPVVEKHRIYLRRPTDEAARLPALELSARPSESRRGGTPARPPRTAGALELQQHRQMLEHHGPPSLIVGPDNEILHLSETAGRYLQRPGGHPSDDILREIRPELRLDLQAALIEAFDHRRATSTRPIRVEFDGDADWVHLIVRPGPEKGTPDRALVLFAEVEATDVGAAPAAEQAAGEEESPRVHQLEREVQRLRDRLQVTIEEYESSKEVMKAANEELQSINEEYKSTAEELETSREELQSVNEELATVNEELKGKVDELAHANSDLRNLMAATEVGTLFLDHGLRIQRYTPHITELFNVMPGDVGRPIAHLTNEVHYDDLVEDAERVMDELVPLEREVRGRDGRWFLMRMRPYRTIEERIDGLVVTFLDVTGRREQERARRKAEERYRLLVENVKEYAIITLDTDGLITTWNVGAQRLFGYSEDEAVGRPGTIIFTPEDRETGADTRELELAADTGHASDERWHVRKGGSRFWGTGVMTALYLPGGELRGFAKVMRDNTERKRAQQALEELAESLEDRVEERTRQVRELASTLTMAEQQERNRIARILHSDLQQILYSIQMKLTMLREPSGDTDGRPPDAAGLREIEGWVNTALTTTRRLTVDLSPPVLADEGLTEALRWLRTLMAELHGLDVRIEADGPFYIPDEDWRVLLFQVVRELLFNVVKHAETDVAHVELQRVDDELVIEVTDEGRGFDVEATAKRRASEGNVGLVGMAERLDLFGGRLEIDSAPGEGARVRVHASIQPMRPDAEAAGAGVPKGTSDGG